MDEKNNLLLDEKNLPWREPTWQGLEPTWLG